MKKLLLLAALAFGNAQANEYYVAPNKSGGEIVLTLETTDSCGEGLFFMYVVNRNQEPTYGCWTLIAGKIHVRFNDGTRRVYDDKGWVRRESM